MKIKTSTPIKDLSGKPVISENQVVTVGQIIANALVSTKHGGKMKMYILATKFYEQKEVDVDTADLALIKQAVEESPVYNNLFLGQALIAVEAAK